MRLSSDRILSRQRLAAPDGRTEPARTRDGTQLRADLPL
jgi:hypothetical protein